MTQTIRTTRRIYQRSPAAGGDGVLSNPLASVSATTGEFRITTEADRTRLYDVTAPFTPVADFLGRIVSVTNTPPTSGSAGTNKHDYTWWRISDVDPGGTWVELEGHRSEDAGTGIEYKVHASVDFSATSAAFAVDEGPLGPNSAPYPLKRTNTGPTVGQGIFFPGASDNVLTSQPFYVGNLNPGGGGTGTTCRLVDWTGRFLNLPTGTGLRWELRDLPAYTEEMLFMLMKRFILSCGWTLEQSRGKNNGTGAGRNIVRDEIFKSVGEDMRKEAYLRILAGNSGTSEGGGYSTDTTSMKGFDFAMFSAWDRDFANGSGINPGNGIGGISVHENTSTFWAVAADTPNTTAQGLAWSTDIPSATISSGSAFGEVVSWSSPFHSTSSKQRFRANALGTVEGGDLSEIHYTFIGDADQISMIAEAPGFGYSFITLGFLTPRADQNPTIFTTNFSVQNGSNVTLRVGGDPAGSATDDGLDPEDPAGNGSLPPYQIGDRIQIAGKTVNPGINPGTSHSGEFIVPAQIISFPGLLPAIGTIQTPAGSLVSDGDTLTIDDGTTSVTFEFDSGGGVSGGNTAVAFTGADPASTVASALQSAIAGSALNITASVNSSTVSLESNLSGAGVGAGNVPIIASLNNAGSWTIEGMGGGGYSIEVASLPEDFAAGAKVGEDPDPIFLYSHHKSIRNTQADDDPFNTEAVFVLGNRAEFGNPTYYDGAIPDGGTNVGYGGFEAFGPLESIDTWGESNPNRRGGRFNIVPILCRDQGGNQLRGNLKFLRFASARIRDHKFVRDRNGDYHYIVPTGINRADQEVATSAISSNFVLGPIPEGHVLV